MLAALTVRDIVLIEQAALEFAPGLNVLTGETGAGKSILLDSLGLAVGGRGRAGVRPGAAQGLRHGGVRSGARSWRARLAARTRRWRMRARSCCAAVLPPTANPAPSSMTKRSASACSRIWAACCWKCMARRTIAACSIFPPIAACWMRSADLESQGREVAAAACRLDRGTRGPGGSEGARRRSREECRLRPRRGQGIVGVRRPSRARRKAWRANAP